MTIGVGIGVIEPTFTSDVVANLLFGIPAILIPLVLLWDAPGEHRMREERAAELTLFYLPYTAFSQICYELVFLIGHPLGWWTPTTDPGIKWLWWQYGLADTRYASGNPWTFALEVVGVTTGIVVIFFRGFITEAITRFLIRRQGLTEVFDGYDREFAEARATRLAKKAA
jgi:hypothetical protein